MQVSNRRPPNGTNQQVLVPEGLTEIQLLQLLAPLATAKWLHLQDIGAMFKGFADPQHKTQFEAWWQGVVRPWCCRAEDGAEVSYGAIPAQSIAAGSGGETATATAAAGGGGKPAL